MKDRRRFTIDELALFFGKHRNTMSAWVKKYDVDLYDASSVLKFVKGIVLEENLERNPDTMVIEYGEN